MCKNFLSLEKYLEIGFFIRRNSNKANIIDQAFTWNLTNGYKARLLVTTSGSTSHLNLVLVDPDGGTTGNSLLSNTGSFISSKANAVHTAVTVSNIGGATSALYGHVSLRDEGDSSLTASSSVAATPAAVYKVYDICRLRYLSYSLTTNGYVDIETSTVNAYQVGNMVYVFFVLYILIEIPAKSTSQINLIRELPLAATTSITLAGMTNSGESVKLIISKSTDVIRTSANNPSTVNAGDTLTGYIVYYTEAN